MTWIVSFTFIQTLNEGTAMFQLWVMYYLITLPIFMAHTYLIAYWLLPHSFFKGRYLLFACGIFLLLLFFSLAELLLSKYVVFGVFDKNREYETGYLSFRNIVISGIGNHYIILVFLAIKAGISWYQAQYKKEALLLSKVETDLEIYRYQLQPKMVLTLVEELEVIAEQHVERTPEMIIKISGFLNRFLFEGKEQLIPLQQEIQLMEDFLAIHKYALGERITSDFIAAGNLNSFVVPPLLLLPVINSAIKLVYECNKTFESTVLIKAEKKYLLFSFTFWSENEFSLNDQENENITRKRLEYNYPGKHRLVENVDANFSEFSLEIFN